MFGHQLAPELERILPRRMRQLVHEAFDVDRVLVDVHAAPEARRDMRVAHRMFDQEIGNAIAERGVAASAARPAKVAGSMPLTMASGRSAARIDWPEIRM